MVGGDTETHPGHDGVEIRVLIGLLILVHINMSAHSRWRAPNLCGEDQLIDTRTVIMILMKACVDNWSVIMRWATSNNQFPVNATISWKCTCICYEPFYGLGSSVYCTVVPKVQLIVSTTV